MDQNQSENANQNWERQALEHLLLENLKETRKARRWKAVFRILTLLVFVGVILAVFDFHLPGRGMGTEKHTALVTLEGEISSSSMANALDINSSLTAAFENENSAGVVLRINSPGGSPVQAGMINDEIHRLRKLYPSKPFYVVVEDICASGGYYVAVAGDQILVDKASLVGSIGVIMEGFGFTGLMDKLGVTRRMITAGSNKGMMDPFSKENPQQVEMIKTMIDEIHQQFIAVVKAGRGDRLKETSDMFSGRVWNGEQAIKNGLVDGYGTVETVARDTFKAPDILDYTMKENFAERVAKRFGAEVGAAAGKALVKTPDLK
ncbi:MAG: signal peptide peptidase SppA [Rhodoferax sp.]|jgi:protease-4|uniref:signal peptide peptidase SppA n=1 Tax=Polynucleobacter sp. MG-Unter2-18 TaxID=2081052 RepID=UPI001BFD5AE6|nr:signal peptide peptidase SppA [Polynucleobacter sp. MG-Unter2-18]MCF8166220.1 signal peptide peptidase SppA [Rhodoferax sp.]MCF8190540.1 signal peptide peptidase SppA [Polynucleobacter sp.]QWD94054.1 signal peptide peptidase SppA [Polynucleobacter sp. MG-Unter2-18]